MSTSAAPTVARPTLRFDIDNRLEAAVTAGARSVHTSSAALAQGEAEIDRIGKRLRAAGRL